MPCHDSSFSICRNEKSRPLIVKGQRFLAISQTVEKTFDIGSVGIARSKQHGGRKQIMDFFTQCQQTNVSHLFPLTTSWWPFATLTIHLVDVRPCYTSSGAINHI